MLLDAAHNPEGARALRQYLAAWHPERPVLVIGVMRDKDADGILRELLPVTSSVIATAASTPRAMPANELAARVTALDAGEVCHRIRRRRSTRSTRRCRRAERYAWRDRFSRRRGPRASLATPTRIARTRTNGVISCGDSIRSDVYPKATKGFLLSCVACLWAAAALAQTAAPPAPPPQTTQAPAESGSSSPASMPLGVTNFSSWKFERVGDHLHLINQAAIEGPNLKFFADDIDLYEDTQSRGRERQRRVHQCRRPHLRPSELEFDTATGIGTFYDASGIMSLGAKASANVAAFGGQDPDVYFYGAKLEKLGARRCRITSGGFTTCVQPTPRWEVTSGSVVLNLDDYAIARNTLLKVKGVPMIYLPVVYYPIQQESARDRLPAADLRHLHAARPVDQQRILLGDQPQPGRDVLPRLVHAGRHGRRQPNIATSPACSRPATSASIDSRSARTQFTQSATRSLPAKTSYEFTGAVTQALGGAARARMRLDYFSDVLTQQLYQQNIYQASRRNRIIEAGVSDAFGPLSTTLLYQRNETFNDQTSSFLYGSTPRVSALLAPQQLFGAPIYASMNSEYAYLPCRSAHRAASLTQDNSLSRVDVAPSLRVPLSRLTYLSVNTSAAHRTDLLLARASTSVHLPVDDSLIRDYTQLRTELVGPVFTKIWDTPGSGYAERMKHVIEPAFTIDYTTPINNYKQTPLLTDTSDFVVGGTSRFTYGLTNRLMYRGKTVDGVRGQTREFVTVGLQQTLLLEFRVEPIRHVVLELEHQSASQSTCRRSP